MEHADKEEEEEEEEELVMKPKKAAVKINGSARVICGDARSLDEQVQAGTVGLVVTSPPYPMIQMWDDCFRQMDPTIEDPEEWTIESAQEAFEKMHAQLDVIWEKVYAAVIPGGIVAINIGDATRSIAKNFQLFPNGARTTMGMMKVGFTPLPNIYWKKPTNKPNAFLGSGMLPPNAYITLDCEHILLFRKGGLRKFPAKDLVRQDSAFSQDERNAWFTQIWEGLCTLFIRQQLAYLFAGITGAKQKVVGDRRNAAFPEEIPRRLIKMFSVKGDVVLDPFVGTGTTVIVAKQLDRHGVGFDIDKDFAKVATEGTKQNSITSMFKKK